ncbi:MULTISPECIES: phosphoribosylformylglycinamidine synthase [Clostridia]|jgi:phosphoribosylformylglycinamidine synthase|uniref:Phosphoribosylformylglycinamidine synthase n=1 Tax=Butyribacter intestini TaxID=1703332 RepID=A0AAW3JV65_9FIRM|nr:MULTISPECIES: phosphoribosylformylglycinamidine synthase [Clostridia]KQC86517.1 phosphoribosylformylglycinamidine synthase [Butyribacter intestini]RHP23279.1 phosphoribosylformylglycinamidine synthase [Clostridium sp. AF34-13]RHU77620.1 phosphoribosylformylglycinamidine synthase [Butyribacter intestini]
MGSVRRIYVEKKQPYAVHAKELKEEVKRYLGIKSINNVRVLIRYDVENLSDATYKQALGTVFSEPPVDNCYENEFKKANGSFVFSVEYLPGQFDQRADSAEQCVKLLNEKENPVIRSATTYVFEGDIDDQDKEKIKEYCINPVDSREASENIPETLVQEFDEPADVAIFDGFRQMSEDELKKLYESLNLAMTFKDFLHIQNYFKNEENREPSVTEIRVLDTYWSDHCRHTTFQTELKNVKFEDGYYNAPIEASYEMYEAARKELFKDRPDKYVSLMDIALMGMRKLKADGKLDDMEESDEINACSIVVPVEIDGKTEEWLIFFKNETHNHPTEIEPFGGAATCLGGAIRDPLSGRGYVYQAMRVTGAADPTVSMKDTLPGKLPQRKIVTGAAKGYSSYGNQIGLATGLVNEIYHPNYVAKRMEIGAVMGAAPRRNVIRENSDPGDIIILLGGRTGRDGIGGATGSSKAHTTKSIDVCGAEVQKGNAPTERKIQRLFRREEVSSIIKKCNDFGAGGVSVAIGELADGLKVNLDKVPKKYAGLDGTELAISESQERMAVVVDSKDVDKMLKYAEEENLEAVAVAEVTEEPRLVLSWRDKVIVDLSRAFLDTNGAHQETDVVVTMPDEKANYFDEKKDTTDVKKAWLDTLSDLNVCSQKGLVEMFDSSIGAASVYMPYGGKYQLTPTQSMVAKLPMSEGKCDTVTMMSYGLDPYLASWSPYHGSVYAVISSVAKIVAAGGDYSKIRFTFQEYFRRLGEDPKRWGEPMAALLGAYDAQIKLGLPSIGGKDSMSGTFNDIDVPPTLCSFAVDIAKTGDVVSPELKKAGNVLVKFDIEKDKYSLPVYDKLMSLYSKITDMIKSKVIVSAYAVGFGGICEAVSKMAFGNGLGVKIDESVDRDELFAKEYGSIIAEVSADDLDKIMAEYKKIALVTDDAEFVYGDAVISMKEALENWTGKLESVFPTRSDVEQIELEDKLFDAKTVYTAKNKVARPKVFIPVFPGTNCEYDTTKAFELAGADVKTVVFKNMTESQIVESVNAFEAAIKESQILMFSGGFSAGDEPDGSAKFIASIFRNPKIMEAVHELLQKRDGLALGICNGFQALIKLGLVPFGEIKPQTENAPTLTTNSIGRHISKSVYTKVVTNKSPWLMKAELGGVYAIPASHGEGRFVAPKNVIDNLFANGQVATRYVDLNGVPTMDEDYNPNGSYAAIEGITSPDGRVLGKMAHSERIGDSVAINIVGNQNQHIFESGVSYFK